MTLYQPDLQHAGPRPTGRRRDSRLRLAIPARLETIHGTYPAALLDLSQSGAHIRVDEPLGKGVDAILFWLQFEAFAGVVWSTPTHAGLEFDELIAPAVLLDTRDLAERNTRDEDRRDAFEAARAWYHGHR